jgi:hypothetical protein
VAAKTTEEDMKIDKIKKQKVQHLVNNISEGFNISDGRTSFISFFIIPLLAVKIFGYPKKQKRPQRDISISMKAIIYKS